jgi:hypothetical protein
MSDSKDKKINPPKDEPSKTRNGDGSSSSSSQDGKLSWLHEAASYESPPQKKDPKSKDWMGDAGKMV